MCDDRFQRPGKACFTRGGSCAWINLVRDSHSAFASPCLLVWRPEQGSFGESEPLGEVESDSQLFESTLGSFVGENSSLGWLGPGIP